MNGPATLRSGRRRLALIVATVLACLAFTVLAFAVATPARAADYYGGYSGGCAPRCGGYGYGYRPYYHHHYSGCCGATRRVFERRYIVREYVERSYGGSIQHYGCGGYDHGCGYGGYGSYGYGGYGSSGPFPGTYRSWTSARFPYGYGGVRGAAAPYGYGSPYGFDDY
jgi:hypothetical protein